MNPTTNSFLQQWYGIQYIAFNHSLSYHQWLAINGYSSIRTIYSNLHKNATSALGQETSVNPQLHLELIHYQSFIQKASRSPFNWEVFYPENRYPFPLQWILELSWFFLARYCKLSMDGQFLMSWLNYIYILLGLIYSRLIIHYTIYNQFIALSIFLQFISLLSIQYR